MSPPRIQQKASGLPSLRTVSLASGILFLALAVLPGAMPRVLHIPVLGGGQLRISTPRIWGCLLDVPCKITYTAGRSSVTVLLSQGYVDWCMTALPSTNANVFYCLYNYDGPLVLLRVDTDKKWSIPKSTQSVCSCLVETSPCQIQEASVADWQEALDYLEKLPASAFRDQVVPEIDWGFFWRWGDQRALCSTIAQQIDTLSGHWPPGPPFSRTGD